MARDYAKDMAYLEWQTYGAGQRYLPTENISNLFSKADSPVLTTTTGVYNAIFGADVWLQTNHEANAFGVLPKYTSTKSGWRVISADAGANASGGVLENGNIPDTIKPTYVEVSTKPKTVAHAFDMSEIQQVSAETDDALGFEHLISYNGSQHKLRMGQMLLGDVDVAQGESGNFESIDRVCSNNAEAADVSLDADDNTIYGLDRDGGATWADAYVDSNGNTARDLTDNLLLDMLDNTREAGANSSFFLTGTDTNASIQALFEPQVRYQVLKETKIQGSVNGIETPTGIEVGITVSQLYGLPIIIDQNTTKADSGDTISRIYLLDTSDPEGFGQPRLGIRVNRPTQYFQSGISAGDPFAINRFGDEGVYRTVAELIAYRFDVNGKIRDLQ